MDGLSVDLDAGPIVLLGDRAAFLPDLGCLLIADLHLGKAQAFRSLGVPVPGGTTAHNLARLDRLIAGCQPRELIFLGDLLHARHGRSAALQTTVRDWRDRYPQVDMHLVRGNHDSRAGDPPSDWRIAIVDEPWLRAGWALCHHPQVVPGHYVLAGHLHPCALVASGSDRLRLPCFHLGTRQGVLPAFGGFTGMHPIVRRPGDRVAVVADGAVRLLPG